MLPAQITKFRKAKARGHIAEAEADAIMFAKGFKAISNPATGLAGKQHYDRIYTNGTIQFLAEIKADDISKKTGNVCLELNSLRKSKASMLMIRVIENGKRVWFIMALNEALRLAERRPIKRQTVDFKDNISALIPINDFIELLNPQRL